MRKIEGMTLQQWNKLSKIMNVPKVESIFKTVDQAIADGDVEIVSERTSKRGIELVKLSNGKEFEKSHMATTTFFN